LKKVQHDFDCHLAETSIKVFSTALPLLPYLTDTKTFHFVSTSITVRSSLLLAPLSHIVVIEMTAANTAKTNENVQMNHTISKNKQSYTIIILVLTPPNCGERWIFDPMSGR